MKNIHRLKPLLVNGLLVTLLYTGTGLYVSIIVLVITMVTTYVCFTLNTQLRLEKLIAYLIRYSFQDIGHSVATLEDGYQRKHNRLKALPLPFQNIAQKFVNSIINDFIKTWYIHIGPGEKDFLKEVQDALEYIAIEIYIQLKKVDAENVVINLIRMFQRHIKMFDDCRTIVQNKYSGINDEDLCNCIIELYEAGNIRHIATSCKGAEIDYLKALLDIFLFRFLPKNAFSCEGGRFMLREILTTKLLEPLVRELTDSHFVNQAVVELLEPSIPLPMIMKHWQNVLDESAGIESLSFDYGEISSEEIYDGCGSEENKCSHCLEQSIPKTPKIPKTYLSLQKNQKHIKKVPKVMGETSNENYDENKFNKKEINYQYDKELIRFDKLDMRTSAPVYGSISVRDHERPREQNTLLLGTGTYSSIKNRKSAMSNNIDNSQLKKRLSDSDISHEKSMGDSFHTYNSIPSKEPQWPSAWTVCPPADASMFRQTSFTEMSRKQDDMAEQMKARLSLSHIDLHGLKSMAWFDNVLTAHAQSPQTDENMAYMRATGLHNVLLSSVKDESEEESLQGVNIYSLDGMTDVNHDCSIEGDASCPLCIEMTSMASPFEIDKEKVLFNPKKSCLEHDCGLNYKHYYYAETETAVNSGVPLDDQFFASCEDIVTEPLDLSCSPPNFINADQDGLGSIVKQDGNILVSSNSHSLSNSDYSSDDGSLSYDEIEQYLSDEEFSTSKDNNECPSVVTFKTARDHSTSNCDNFIDNCTKINSKEGCGNKSMVKGRKLKSKLKRSNNKFINFFKGFNSLSRKRTLLSESGISKISDEGLFRSNRSKDHRSKSKYKAGSGSYTSTTQTKFISLPDNLSSLPPNINMNNTDVSELVEEVASEAFEDEEFFEHFPSEIENSSVDPLSNEIAVTSKGVLADSRSNKSYKSVKGSSSGKSDVTPPVNSGAGKEDTSILQLFQGEVIKPHPSKIPAAWFYPIQMVSIPDTESAIEKGWERGMNNYTLYNIHYDIRIWPDVYQKHLAATMQSNNEESAALIREIKRRYREFIYLHNRFTHGPLSKYMKGILRPNRRYALPFGRMDPDVIEGRRRILETYLVSLVSRIELCNSREFKEFLGSENHQDVVVVKPTIIAQKQMCNSQMGKVMKVPNGQSIPGPKEHKDSQYFIHGYEVQRMFGYADSIDRERNSVLHYFVENYEDIRKLNRAAIHVPLIEPIQIPYAYTNGMLEMRDIALGIRTDGDGAEVTDDISTESHYLSQNDTPVNKLEETSFNVIAAKFSPELASQLEKENSEMKIAREKDLFESSWPLTDAVLSIVCQALKGYGSWLCFERVQQAILFSIGGLIEWLIKREMAEFLMKERWYKYFCDLYSVVWNEDGTLKEKKKDPTQEEREGMKKQALTSLLEIIPSIVMISIGPGNYRKGCENLLHTLQYPAVNRHLLFAALEIILFDLIPELRDGYPEYTSASQPNGKSTNQECPPGRSPTIPSGKTLDCIQRYLNGSKKIQIVGIFDANTAPDQD